MIFVQLQIGGYDNNFTYVVGNEDSREVFLVDPVNREKIELFLKENNFILKAIVLTHGHFDHVGVSADFSDFYEIPVYLHKDDFFLVQEKISNLYDISILKILNICDTDVEIIKTPGHTPGSVCLKIEDKLLTGDTVFVGRSGRTDFPYSSSDLMKKSIKKLKKLSNNVLIYPGHDYGDQVFSTIAREKQLNIDWLNS